MSSTPSADLETHIIELLSRGPRKARFVSELAVLLPPDNPSDNGLERALETLEAAGRVLVREQYCADPHLGDADLRIVALIREPPAAESQSDPLSVATADIEATWNRWLAEYLASHRCG